MKRLSVLEACCAPLLGRPLEQDDAADLASYFKVLSDPARLRLLSLIANHADGEACVCDLVEPAGVSQPTVSHHLKVLHQAGLLEREKKGTWVYYRIVPGALAALRDALAVPARV